MVDLLIFLQGLYDVFKAFETMFVRQFFFIFYACDHHLCGFRGKMECSARTPIENILPKKF